MPEWFRAAPDWVRLAVDNGDPVPPPGVVVVRMAIALLCGLCVAALYRVTLGRNRKDLRSLPTTLVLLSFLIAVVTLVIGNNSARAFGLVGALSIVRFRTVVEDTADTAFVISAVTLGMAVGSGYVFLAVIALPVVAGVTLAMSRYDRRPGDGSPVVLLIRCPAEVDPNLLLAACFAAHAESQSLTGLETASKGSALEAKFAVRLRDPAGLVAFLTEVRKIDGVQDAELKQAN